MKTLNNYITERLNPRHLGNTDINQVIVLKGTLEWDLVDLLYGKGIHHVFKSDKWCAGVISYDPDPQDDILLFWSPESKYVPVLSRRNINNPTCSNQYPFHLIKLRKTPPFGRNGLNYLIDNIFSEDAGKKYSVPVLYASVVSIIPQKAMDLVYRFEKNDILKHASFK
jgi:hypothetical protein